MNDSVTITLRNVETSDISIFFEQQLDPEANRMAAFVRADPHDRAAFDAHWKRIMDSAGIVNKTILRGEEVADHVSCYPREGELEVTYWLGKKHWGKGIATQALKKLLQEITHRLLFARAAKDNIDRSGCYRNAISRLSVKTRILLEEEVKRQRNIFSV